MTEFAIEAQDLQLRSKRGMVYGPLDWALERGQLGVVSGPPDSGKSTLMLTFTGRMKPSEPSKLRVLGSWLPGDARRVQQLSSVMGVGGLDDLDDVVTVRATVRERLAWLAPWYRVVRNPSDEQITQLCAPAFGQLPIPSGSTRIYKLSESSNLLLRIALALASKPELIAVDAVDQLHDVAERAVLWRRLDAIAASGITVVASTTGIEGLDTIDWTTPPTHLDLGLTDAAKES
ncbi:ABC transporter [Propionibacterium cyclohexanicum]|uniref:ABC transporter n=1 Tax=Propionibacterium cyclohexanicum TaxID=64702 RepID=A0A1H9QCY6_9ACTN|nr:ATP-binding cassette domain-containing protein [Propionibacterium cyclohexanicum]SER58278.1 ABC transporter [Propionibacterium cyclohexanicum]